MTNKKTKGEAEKTLNKPIRDHPNRKTAFVVSYFTPDKELGVMLPYNTKKGCSKPQWEKGPEQAELAESSFNPFKMSVEEIKKLAMETEQELIKSEGKKETIELPMKFKINVFRYNGRVFFQIFNHKGEGFGTTTPEDDNDNFKHKFLGIEKNHRFFRQFIKDINKLQEGQQ